MKKKKNSLQINFKKLIFIEANTCSNFFIFSVIKIEFSFKN